MVIGILAVGFQLNDVIASTAIKEYDVIRQITDLGAWFVHTKTWLEVCIDTKQGELKLMGPKKRNVIHTRRQASMDKLCNSQTLAIVSHWKNSGGKRQCKINNHPTQSHLKKNT